MVVFFFFFWAFYAQIPVRTLGTNKHKFIVCFWPFFVTSLLFYFYYLNPPPSCFPVVSAQLSADCLVKVPLSLWLNSPDPGNWQQKDVKEGQGDRCWGPELGGFSLTEKSDEASKLYTRLNSNQFERLIWFEPSIDCEKYRIKQVFQTHYRNNGMHWLEHGKQRHLCHVWFIKYSNY